MNWKVDSSTTFSFITSASPRLPDMKSMRIAGVRSPFRSTSSYQKRTSSVVCGMPSLHFKPSRRVKE